MRFRRTFFALLCLFISRCIGDPAEEIAQTSTSTPNRYTNEEDQFILEELTRIGEKFRYIPVTGKHVWKEIEEHHREKWKQGTPGFNFERTLGSLRSRFVDVLLHNHEETKVKVPDTLKRKFINPKRKMTGHRNPYTDEENNFIIEELLKPTTNPLSLPTYNEIRAEHDKRRKVNTQGFENERTVLSICSRVATMRDNGLLPNEIMEKSLMRRKGAGGSESSHSSSQPNLQEYNEEDEDAAMADLVQNFLRGVEKAPKRNPMHNIKYTEEEDKFIIDQLLSLCNDGVPLSHNDVWEKVAQCHREKWKASTPGFPQVRLPRSLYRHFRCFMLPNPEQNRVEVPTSIIQEFDAPKPRKLGKATKIRYSKGEDDLIIQELLKPSCVSIFGLSTMESILTEHDKKRKAGIRGFQNERTLHSLRSRLTTMKNRGLLPAEIMEKIWLYYETGASSSGATQQSQQTDTQAADMVAELKNTDCVVDFSQLD